MDDLNMANAELAAKLPPEASSGDLPPSTAQPPAADATAGQTPAFAAEQPYVPPTEPMPAPLASSTVAATSAGEWRRPRRRSSDASRL